MVEAKVDFKRYETDIKELVARGGKKEVTVFYGSSTFTFWGHEKLKRDMSPIEVVNCGFGGSTAHDAAHWYEKVVKPLRPKLLVWYEGDNDIALEYSSDEVLEITANLFDKIKSDFPKIRILIVSVKKSIARKELWRRIDELNSKMLEYANSKGYLSFVDINEIAFNEEGSAKTDIYIEDKLHFNEKGYELLTALIKPVIREML
jgi:lysophospholipase L1-like esterase